MVDLVAVNNFGDTRSGGLAGTVLYVAYAALLLPANRLAPALVLASTVLPSAWIALQEALFIGTRTHHWIALVAVMPGMVAEIGVLVRPLRVEAVLLTMLVFLGVNVAWLLLFDQAPPPSDLGDPTQARWR